MREYEGEKRREEEREKPVWNRQLEQVFQGHKAEIRRGLTKYASTGPWNKVVLGEMDRIRADLPTNGRIQRKDTQSKQPMDYQKVLHTVSSIPSLNECLDKKNF